MRFRANKAALRKFLTATVALAVLVGTARLTAQQPEVKPGPEHEKLKEAEGTWDATIKSMGGDSKGTLACKIGLGGLWLLEHFTSDFGGMTFEGRGATSYDPTKKKYVNIWIDSMSTSPMVSEGNYDKKTKTMTMVGNMPMPDGKSTKITMTTVAKDADTKTFTMKTAGPDGKDLEMLHITYKRRAK
jgi:hypothetical protein